MPVIITDRHHHGLVFEEHRAGLAEEAAGPNKRTSSSHTGVRRVSAGLAEEAFVNSNNSSSFS